MQDKRSFRLMIILLFLIVILIGFSNYLNYLPSVAKSTFLILLVLLVLFYESRKPMKDLKDVSRRYQRTSLFSRNKAIEILNEGLNLESLNNNEKLYLHMQIALEYYKMKDYKNAVDSFKKVVDEAIKTQYVRIEEKFLIKLVGSFVLEGRRQEAEKIYQKLLALEKCDRSKIVEGMLKEKN